MSMRTDPTGPSVPSRSPAGAHPALLLEGCLAASARGDDAAFAQVYRATSSRVFGLVLRILRDRAAAEDVTCEVYTQLWRKSAEFDPLRGTAIAWILTMARTRAIDRLRGEDRIRLRETALEAATELPHGGGDPHHQLIEEQRAVTVRQAVASLPTEQREAILLAYFGGLSHSEAAEALGAPLGTVKTRIRTALATLRRALAGSEGTLA